MVLVNKYYGADVRGKLEYFNITLLKAMKILITGANGLLGQYLLMELAGKGATVLATGKGPSRLAGLLKEHMEYRELDITDNLAVNQLLQEFNPHVLIHGAALTQADYCELNKQECWNVNVTATGILLEAARKTGTFFLFVSTDFIFDGRNGPYKEEDFPGPLNYYGMTKLAAEKVVADWADHFAIIRTILVYGKTIDGTRSNIISWVQHELEQGHHIRVVDDQVRTPTYAGDLAKGILLVAAERATGVWHISGQEMLTPYQMSIRVAEALKLNKNLIEKTDASRFTQPAVRPLRTGFIIDKAMRELGYQPISFDEGIRKMTESGMDIG